MDWTKAKNILIVALILTNIVLASVMICQNIEENKARKTFLSDTIDILADRNVFVDAAIPNDRVSMPVLSIEFDQMDYVRLNNALSKQNAVSENTATERDYIAQADALLESAGLMTENVRFGKLERSKQKTTVTYYNFVKDIAIEDSYIQCTIQDGMVSDVERLWLKPVEFGKTKKEVIPVAEALIQFMNENQEYDVIHIEKIELVYWLDTSSFDGESAISDTAFPAWKITYNSGKIKRITAFNQ